jgi:hypothetical protein
MRINMTLQNTMLLGLTMLAGPVAFVFNRAVRGLYPEYFIAHTIWHVCMPLTGFTMLHAICSRYKDIPIVE